MPITLGMLSSAFQKCSESTKGVEHVFKTPG